MYDIIGDIHGHADELVRLLELLGYQRSGGIYSHPDRQVVFVGDFVDRGPRIRETLELVRPMIDAGSAYAVMGNHEFNAIAYHTPDPNRPGKFLREHSAKNTGQHQETLRQVPADSLSDYIEWFRTLPMWWTPESQALRVVHACWDAKAMRIVADALEQHGGVTDAFMVRACQHDTPQFQAVEDVLKGKEVSLPAGKSVLDKDGNARTEMRIKWYRSPKGVSYASYALPENASYGDQPLPDSLAGSIAPYPADEVPVFFGHYWLRAETPARLATNVACVDYSIAKQGMLCAYRWDGESQLSDDKFYTVPAAH